MHAAHALLGCEPLEENVGGLIAAFESRLICRHVSLKQGSVRLRKVPSPSVKCMKCIGNFSTSDTGLLFDFLP